MGWNITYFLSNLPGDFDSWNTTTRLGYYFSKLWGFSSLNITDQTWIAETFSGFELQKLANSYQFANDGEGLGLNRTVLFLQSLIDR